ncbi:MAG: AtpZ/AtpI family protein [Kiloniellales bacterium]|nr:AtpZ/AtpI family protein [Kiloniellales bacterium]
MSGSGLGFGLRIAVDLLAGLAIGVGLGLLLDEWLNTSPLMMVVFLFLGAAAGMLNVYRAATGRGFAVGYRQAGDDGAEQGEAPPANDGRQVEGPSNGGADEDRGGKS